LPLRRLAAAVLHIVGLAAHRLRVPRGCLFTAMDCLLRSFGLRALCCQPSETRSNKNIKRYNKNIKNATDQFPTNFRPLRNDRKYDRPISDQLPTKMNGDAGPEVPALPRKGTKDT
jgi:hypothetical protein